MCLNPIKLHNPKKSISLNGGHLFEMEIPCGKCAECLERKKNDWYFRCYYEAKSTFDKGGYVLFDTLTYADPYLPHINDYLNEEFQLPDEQNMSCFNVEHYRLFMVRLRRALTYRGFNIKDNLKYFLTSEYGTDERYTHRPHYHILFFVSDPSLDPLELSRMVNQCWQMGRTDGIDYHPIPYVMNHVFGYKYNCDRIHMQMVCNYVAKYVTKDSEFSKKVEKRVDDIFESFVGVNWRDDDLSGEGKRVYNELRKQCLQFNRQSHGFGEDFLKYNDMSEILKTGMIAMPDKKNIVKHTPLPTYYQRKLFYEIKKDAFGNKVWQLNDLGKDYKLNRAYETVDRLTTRFNDWLTMMSCFDYYHDSNDTQWYKRILERFTELNNGRDLRQFAQYLVFYKGRFKSPGELERESKGIFRVDDADEFYRNSFNDSGDSIYYYGSSTDYKKFRESFLSNQVITDVKDNKDIEMWRKTSIIKQRYCGYKPTVFDKDESFSITDMLGSMRNVFEFKRRMIINEKADDRFIYYDWMWSFYCEAQLEKNEFKQKQYDEFIATKKRLKASGMYVKNI